MSGHLGLWDLCRARVGTDTETGEDVIQDINCKLKVDATLHLATARRL